MPHYMQVCVCVFSLNFFLPYTVCVWGGLVAHYTEEQFLYLRAFECM